MASGLSADGAYRDRVVDADGTVVREVRLVADLAGGVTEAGPAVTSEPRPRLGRPRRGPPARGRCARACRSGVATGAYGISFGALSVAAGLAALAGHGPVAAAVLRRLAVRLRRHHRRRRLRGAGRDRDLVAARHPQRPLRPAARPSCSACAGAARAAAAHLTIDESTAVAVAQPERAAARLGFWVTGLAVFVLWNLMTLVGALIGDLLGDPQRYGLDAAACAAFCALLWPRLSNRDAVAIASSRRRRRRRAVADDARPAYPSVAGGSPRTHCVACRRTPRHAGGRRA